MHLWKSSRVFLVVLTCCGSSIQGSEVHLQVIKAEGNTGPEVEVSWTLPHSGLSLTWAALTYTSQVASKEVGAQRLESSASSFVIREGLKFEQQYRVCVSWEAPGCRHLPSLCSFLKVPRRPPSLAHKGPSLYLVLGPVHSKNVTVVWGETPPLHPNDHQPSPRGFRVAWRRVEGRVGHPGHSSTIVSNKHLIRGLIPGTRYEVCVGETVASDSQLTCDVITTAEDVPGPPVTEAGTCSSQAQGTHWRCDVTWSTPDTTNGRITGYLVEWKDKEGYVLMESAGRGVLCDPTCYHSQVVTFLPSEVCVTAATTAGHGWHSCAPIHGVRERLLALLELKVLVIIGATVLSYQLGPALLRALLHCCIRGLYRHVEGEKQHPI